MILIYNLSFFEIANSSHSGLILKTVKVEAVTIAGDSDTDQNGLHVTHCMMHSKL